MNTLPDVSLVRPSLALSLSFALPGLPEALGGWLLSESHGEGTEALRPSPRPVHKGVAQPSPAAGAGTTLISFWGFQAGSQAVCLPSRCYF